MKHLKRATGIEADKQAQASKAQFNFVDNLDLVEMVVLFPKKASISAIFHPLHAPVVGQRANSRVGKVLRMLIFGRLALSKR